MKRAKKQGALPVVKESLRVAGRGVVRHRNIWCAFLNLAAPVAALCLLLATVRYWTSMEFGLSLTYNGESIGVIENEKVFEDATEMVSQRMVHAGSEGDGNVSMTPTFSLVVSDGTEYTIADTVCNKIIEQSDGIIEEATGLYINGELVGAVKSSADLSHILQGILDEAKGDDEDATAVFAQTVESVTGLFPTSTVITSDEMEEELSASSQKAITYVVQEGDTAVDIAQKNNMSLDELENLNAGVADGLIHVGDVLTLQTAVSRLEVQIIKTETYQESLPYKTITQTDDNEYTDYSAVITEGSEGVQECVDRVTYLNGVEVSRENISTTVITPAVDRVVVIGTQERPKHSGIGTGTFIWPCPSLHTITTYY
ncbi:MAG: G5 domain-containing protein, partial [Hydrogeniiclostridium sp.]